MDIIVLKSFLPEIFLSLCILGHLVFNIFLIKHSKTNFPLIDKEHLSQCFFIISCCLLLVYKVKIEGVFSNHLIVNNSGLIALKVLILILTLFIFIPSWRHYVSDNLNFYEFFNLYLLAVLVFLLLINVNDLLLVYLLVEMQSLIFYILANFKRLSAFSTEAGLKYFISGSVFSGIFLLGSSILYGIFGTLNYYNLELLLSVPLTNYSLHTLVVISIFLITSMLFFKLTIAPFHLWSPDVYEGAPISSTIILSTVPKLILLTVLMRWMAVTYYVFIDFSFLFSFLGLLSILFGIFFANRQKRLKRFIAYSSISQLGYTIILLCMINYDTYASVYFFITIYLIASIALWSFVALINCFRTNTAKLYLKEKTSFYISNLAHYVKYNKGWSFSLLVIFASLAGIPPLSGFLPKVFVFIALTESDKWFLNIVLVILSCIIIWYYINVITILFMEVKSKFIKTDFTSLQIIHSKMYLDEIDYLVSSLGTFLLIALFFNPSFLYLVCQYFTLYLL